MTTSRAMDGAGARRRRSRAAVALLAAALLIVTAAFAACAPRGPVVNEGQAATLASEFFDGAHGSGAKVVDVQIESVVLDHDAAGRTVWRVTIQGSVIEAGRATPSYGSAMTLFVDAQTGAVSIWAQG